MKNRSIKVFVNGRFLCQNAAGVHRFGMASLISLHNIFGDRLVILVPSKELVINSDRLSHFHVREVPGGSGHFWEQITLPIFMYTRGKGFLFCFSGLPPLVYHKTIYTIHDMAVYAFPETFTGAYSRFYRRMLKLAVKRARTLTAVSEFTRDEVWKYLGARVPHLTSNVIEKTNPSNQDANVLRRYGVAGRSFALSVGTIEPRKNFSILRAAVMATEWPDLAVIVVGGGGRVFATSDNSAKQTANLEYVGYVSDEDLKVLYSEAEIFIYPSLYEGFGIPPLEALASGCPVVVAKSASLPEVCGDAAEYFDPRDRDDLIRAVRRVLGVGAQERQNRYDLGMAQVANYSSVCQQRQWLQVCRSLELCR